MCNCKQQIEAKLLGKFKEQAPEASNHAVQLKGYALIFGEKLTQKGKMDAELVAAYPLKKGGEKAKTRTTSMIFTYCPFCGNKYDDTEAT